MALGSGAGGPLWQRWLLSFLPSSVREEAEQLCSRRPRTEALAHPLACWWVRAHGSSVSRTRTLTCPGPLRGRRVRVWSLWSGWSVPSPVLGVGDAWGWRLEDSRQHFPPAPCPGSCPGTRPVRRRQVRRAGKGPVWNRVLKRPPWEGGVEVKTKQKQGGFEWEELSSERSSRAKACGACLPRAAEAGGTSGGSCRCQEVLGQVL